MSKDNFRSIENPIKIKTDRGIYLGDPCYVLSNENYFQWEKQLGWLAGAITIGNLQWCAGGTCWGDGYYQDNDSSTEYAVDSGSIGIVPLELVEKETNYGRIIEGAGEYIFEDQAGYFTITTPSGKVIIIDTDECEYDDDDEEDYFDNF